MQVLQEQLTEQHASVAEASRSETAPNAELERVKNELTSVQDELVAARNAAAAAHVDEVEMLRAASADAKRLASEQQGVMLAEALAQQTAKADSLASEVHSLMEVLTASVKPSTAAERHVDLASRGLIDALEQSLKKLQRVVGTTTSDSTSIGAPNRLCEELVAQLDLTSSVLAQISDGGDGAQCSIDEQQQMLLAEGRHISNTFSEHAHGRMPRGLHPMTANAEGPVPDDGECRGACTR